MRVKGHCNLQSFQMLPRCQEEIPEDVLAEKRPAISPALCSRAVHRFTAFTVHIS